MNPNRRAQTDGVTAVTEKNSTTLPSFLFIAFLPDGDPTDR